MHEVLGANPKNLTALNNRDQTRCDPQKVRSISAERILEGIEIALNKGRYAEAAIRLVQNQTVLTQEMLLKANFNPNQPRDERGEWSAVGLSSTERRSRADNTTVSVTDAYCRIVKELCIVEATAVLPTSDFGASFFKALNACMDRHGCLGRA